MKKATDLTVGDPARNILSFSIPVLLGALFQQLYNMTDTMIVGRFLGEEALAAVGSTGSTVYLIIGTISGLTEGFGILASQAFGARHYADLRKLVGQGLILTALISVLISIPTVLFCRQILLMLNMPANILDYGEGYLRVIFGGVIFTMSYNVAAGFLRSIGDSRTPLYFLVFSSLLNIALDIWFIVGWKLGTVGAGLATVISQGLSAFLCLSYMFRTYELLRIHPADLVFHRQLALRMLKFGIPMSVNQSVTTVGIMILQSGINTFGSSVMAAFAAATKVENLVAQPMISLGLAMSTFCGQNFGAHHMERIRSGIRKAMVLSAGAAALGMVFYLLAGAPIVGAFLTTPSPEVLAYAKQYLFTSVWFLPMLSWIFIFRNALVGLGNGFVSLLGGILELVSRFLCIQFLLPIAGFWCVRLTNPITWTAACFLFGYLLFRWERHSLRS